MFVEYTRNGELASRLRELTSRLASTLGFKVKIVERAGASIKSQFPTNNLWEGQKCGREDCTTCEQGAEMLPDWTRSSVLYENVCEQCNPEAGKDKELNEVQQDIPTLYVGETSRSIYERSGEHWGDWRSNKEGSHMRKHQEEAHEGAAPKFCMRVVKSYKSALSRQIGEAVRIRRRGGAGCILNSKSEFDRCQIPRLTIEEQDEEKLKKRKEEEEQEMEKILSSLEEQTNMWGEKKLREREQADKLEGSRLTRILERSTSTKREPGSTLSTGAGAQSKRRKKLKHKVEEEDWGGEAQEQEQVTQPDQAAIWELTPPKEQVTQPDQAAIWELTPPKEQRIHPRRGKQSSIRSYCQQTVEAPKGSPPELADNTRISGILPSVEEDEITTEYREGQRKDNNSPMSTGCVTKEYTPALFKKDNIAVVNGEHQEDILQTTPSGSTGNDENNVVLAENVVFVPAGQQELSGEKDTGVQQLIELDNTIEDDTGFKNEDRKTTKKLRTDVLGGEGVVLEQKDTPSGESIDKDGHPSGQEVARMVDNEVDDTMKMSRSNDDNLEGGVLMIGSVPSQRKACAKYIELQEVG